MNIWKVMAHHEDPERMVRWSKRVGRIAVGWGRTGDLRNLRDVTPREIQQRIAAKYPDLSPFNKGGPSLFNFWCMKIGDLVIITRGVRGRSHVVKISGKYRWMSRRQSVGDYQHQRTVTLTDLDSEKLWARVERAKNQNLRWAVVRCRKAK